MKIKKRLKFKKFNPTLVDVTVASVEGGIDRFLKTDM